MTDLELIRTIIGDSPQYGVYTATADGDATEFQVNNYPMATGTAKVRVGNTLQAITSQYTIDEEIGLVTLRYPPATGLEVSVTFKYTILSDAQLTGLMGQYDTEPVKLGAADALDIIASSEAMIQKKTKIMDVTTDGPAVAAELRKHAKTLRDQVFSDTMVESTFDIAEQINEEFGLREKILKDYIKEL